MRFFKLQRDARGETRRLLFVFALTVALLVVAVNAALAYAGPATAWRARARLLSGEALRFRLFGSLLIFLRQRVSLLFLRRIQKLHRPTSLSRSRALTFQSSSKHHLPVLLKHPVLLPRTNSPPWSRSPSRWEPVKALRSPAVGS